jgi:glycine cleavage system H protein
MSGDSSGASLTFAMGEFQAEFPTDRLYARNHMWAQHHGSVMRFGFTAYAVRLLQDVYFLDWTIESPALVKTGQQMGSIESKKAESDLFAPLDGQLVAFNTELLQDPATINVDKYGRGWLFEVAVDDSLLMSPQAYVQHLDEVWVVTQRTIKGQLNE